MEIPMNYIDFVSSRFFRVAILCFLIPYFYYLAHYLAGGNFAHLEYMETSYVVNYFDYGFVKRGLVGSLVHLFPPSNIKLLIVAVNVGAFVALLLVARGALAAVTHEPTAKILKALVAVSPFTFFQFSFDTGRLDILNILLLAGAMYSIFRGYWWLPLALAFVGLLIHEAFVAYGVPLIFAAMLVKRKLDLEAGRASRYSPAFLLAFAILCGALSLLILKFGNSELVVRQSAGAGQEAWSRPLIQHGMGLGLLTISIAALVLAVLYGWLVSLYRSNDCKLDVLFLSACAPIALFFLGWDYARWCALAFITILFAVYLKVVASGWRIEYRSLKYGMAMALLPLGPIGCTDFFPHLQALAQQGLRLASSFLA